MKSRMLLSAVGWLAFVLLSTLGVGCGGTGGSGVNKVTVTGTATYDGKPIQQGSIEFILQEANLKGGSNMTGAITNGKFSVAGVSPGKNIVTIGNSASAGGGDTGPASYAQMRKTPIMTPENMAKLKADAASEAASASEAIARNAPGNGQAFDIKEGMGQLDIKILKK